MATLASSGGPLGNPITYLTYLLRHRTQILAPWIVASSLDLFLGGIYLTLLVQFFFPSNHDCHARRSSSSRRKATNEPKSFLARIISRLPDSPTIIFLVCLVAIFTILKSTAALYILFLNSIVLSDSPLKLAIASFHNWVMVASPLTTHFIDLAVQSYYIILLYNLFRADAGLHFGPFLRWSLFTGIALCFTLATITGILAVYEVLSFRFQHPDLYVLIQLASSFVGDALISGGTVYCLLKSSAHNLR
ncbi:hypothetical protein FRB91_000428 [Serendipita sp. 411]|nr:hypothetical protein FRB91_000428 [Serendipita sp. 411]